jgi:hypothetical protein
LDGFTVVLLERQDKSWSVDLYVELVLFKLLVEVRSHAAQLLRKSFELRARSNLGCRGKVFDFEKPNQAVYCFRLENDLDRREM